MTQHLDFYYDFVSPAAYLAHKRLLQLQAQYDLTVNAIPFFLGGVFKAAGNNSPISVSAKAKYMMEHDLPRFAKRYQVEFQFSPFFPCNTLQALRGAIAAERLGIGAAYRDTLFNAFWIQGKNLADAEVISACLQAQGMDSEVLLALSQTPEIKQQLTTNTEHAVARGAFGAPTMFMNDEMFFGQDRLDFIEAVLKDVV
jgi:2-hydroxychromene-2-carboxylate isomerase